MKEIPFSTNEYQGTTQGFEHCSLEIDSWQFNLANVYLQASALAHRIAGQSWKSKLWGHLDSEVWNNCPLN